MKLSRELSKRDTGKTLYILDEPTTGLHFADIQQLLDVLHRLRDHGNTVVVIEHNLDVIKTADWLVDLGPEGGSRAVRSSPAAHRKRSRKCRSRTPGISSNRCWSATVTDDQPQKAGLFRGPLLRSTARYSLGDFVRVDPQSPGDTRPVCRVGLEEVPQLAQLHVTRDACHRTDDIADQQVLLLSCHQTEQSSRLTEIVVIGPVVISVSRTGEHKRRFGVLRCLLGASL